MQLHCVFGQLKEDYPGQYAPDLIDAVTEYQLEDNPAALDAKIKEAEESKEYSAIGIFILDIGQNGQDLIRKALQQNPIHIPVNSVEIMPKES